MPRAIATVPELSKALDAVGPAKRVAAGVPVAPVSEAMIVPVLAAVPAKKPTDAISFRDAKKVRDVPAVPARTAPIFAAVPGASKVRDVPAVPKVKRAPADVPAAPSRAMPAPAVPEAKIPDVPGAAVPAKFGVSGLYGGVPPATGALAVCAVVVTRVAMVWRTATLSM